jgi:CBS domain-containing protein
VAQSLLESLRGLTVADVMLVTPKTSPADISVSVARVALADRHVQMVLLTEGRVFRGAVTEIPEGADPDSPAIAYADAAAETIAATEPAEAAYERTRRNPHRRVVVLGPDRELVGLLCLDRTLTKFCRGGCP